MPRILIVEDEIKLAELLNDYLIQADFQTQIITDGLAVIPEFKSNTYDLILLDLMLPGKDGLSLCRELREHSDIPIIMVTARVEEIDRLIGLELGADDYICKPFSPREVVARVKSVLRRSGSIPEPQPSLPIELNPANYQAKIYGHDIELTAIEFNLLNILAKEPGRIYSRSQLIDLAYKDHRVVSERTIDSHIKKLRKRLNDIQPDSEIVQSVYGVGYKLEIPN